MNKNEYISSAIQPMCLTTRQYYMPLRIYACCVLTCLMLLVTSTSQAQKSSKQFLKKLLQEQNDSLLQAVLQNPGKYHLQIIYTQINRDKHNQASFRTYTLGEDTTRYFYPASTVKLAAAAAALEKLNDLNVEGLNKYTPLRIDSAYNRQSTVTTDSSSENGMPSVAHYIKKYFW